MKGLASSSTFFIESEIVLKIIMFCFDMALTVGWTVLTRTGTDTDTASAFCLAMRLWLDFDGVGGDDCAVVVVVVIVRVRDNYAFW